MAVECPTPLVAFVGHSGSGKTTLLERLLPQLRQRGLRLAALKHTHHRFDIDHPGKDSHRLRQAGATQVLVASRQRWALITELDQQAPEPDLAALLPQLDHAHLDLILVEGFKHEAVPKIEIYRAALGKPPLFRQDDGIIAVASDAAPDTRLPTLDLNDPPAIAEFVIRHILRHGG